MNDELKAEISKWLAQSKSVEPWNDVTKLALYEQSKKIIQELLKELASHVKSKT